jgi:hypothetical protein
VLLRGLRVHLGRDGDRLLGAAGGRVFGEAGGFPAGPGPASSMLVAPSAIKTATETSMMPRSNSGDAFFLRSAALRTGGQSRTHKVHPSSTSHDKKPQLTTPGM